MRRTDDTPHSSSKGKKQQQKIKQNTSISNGKLLKKLGKNHTNMNVLNFTMHFFAKSTHCRCNLVECVCARKMRISMTKIVFSFS